MKKIRSLSVFLILCIAASSVLCACSKDPCAKGHTWGEWTTSIAATCTKEGEEINTCTVCGETISRDVGVLPHDYVNGKCTGCGIVEATYVPPRDFFLGNVFQIEIQSLGEQTIGMGSGFVLNSDGWFITNSHVMENSYYATALFEIPNEEKGDSFTRLSIEYAALDNPNKDYFIGKIKDYDTIADHYRDIKLSTEYEIGGVTYSVGYPEATPYMEIHRGLALSVATSFEGKLNGVQYVASTSYIMPGSSGGILLNDELEVIGLTTIVETVGGEFQRSYSVSTFNFQNDVAKVPNYPTEELAFFLHPEIADYIRFYNTIKQFSDMNREELDDGVTVYASKSDFEYTDYTSTETHLFGSDFLIVLTFNNYFDNGDQCETMLYGFWSPTAGFSNLMYDFEYTWANKTYYEITSSSINYSPNINLTLHTYEMKNSPSITPTEENIAYAKGYFNTLYEYLLGIWTDFTAT